MEASYQPQKSPTMNFLFVLIAASLTTIAVAASTTSSSSCGDCLPIGAPYDDLYLVTRLWSIIGDNITDLEIIREFESGFAPIVTSLPGFIQYSAAQNANNVSTVYFQNVFSTQEQAHEAQMLALDFVAKNALLNGTIEPYYFSEGTVAFDVASETCVNTPTTNKYLSTRLYKVLKSNVGLTPENMQKDTAALASRYQSKPGFLHYLGAIINEEDGEYLFFSNTYDNEESSKVANDFGTSAANSTQSGDSLLLVSTEGKIIFDYICTDDSTNKDVIDSSIMKEEDNSGSDGMRMTFSWQWLAYLGGLYALLF